MEDAVARACVLFRPTVAYRREVFQSGLRRLGYEVVERPLSIPNSDDLLVMWNRSPHEEAYAQRYERAGAKLVVCENGYIGKDADGHKLFAMALNHHNGVGKWICGNLKRWTYILSEWRTQGDFILLLPQRGIGERGVAMDRYWPQTVAKRLSSLTKRPIRVRPHPGIAKTDPYDALKGAWAAVTWGSGAAIKALYAGVPVFHELRQWIGAPAATYLEKGVDVERPFLGDRTPMFERLAWAQWSLKEIESGEAFACLLR